MLWNPSGAGRGNYGWAAQRLSRATALAAVHWQNPRVRAPQMDVVGEMGEIKKSWAANAAMLLDSLVDDLYHLCIVMWP